MSYWIEDVLFSLLDKLAALILVTVSLGLILLFIFGITDLVQDYRAQPATFACELKQQEARRRTFTANVICVPVPTRRDTLHITK